jgi:hypothetical protein
LTIPRKGTRVVGIPGTLALPLHRIGTQPCNGQHQACVHPACACTQTRQHNPLGRQSHRELLLEHDNSTSEQGPMCQQLEHNARGNLEGHRHTAVTVNASVCAQPCSGQKAQLHHRDGGSARRTRSTTANETDGTSCRTLYGTLATHTSKYGSSDLSTSPWMTVSLDSLSLNTHTKAHACTGKLTTDSVTSDTLKHRRAPSAKASDKPNNRYNWAATV